VAGIWSPSILYWFSDPITLHEFHVFCGVLDELAEADLGALAISLGLDPHYTQTIHPFTLLFLKGKSAEIIIANIT